MVPNSIVLRKAIKLLVIGIIVQQLLYLFLNSDSPIKTISCDYEKSEFLTAGTAERAIFHSETFDSVALQTFRTQQLQYFRKSGPDGQEDSENIILDIAPIFRLIQRLGSEQQRRFRLFIDVGANIGRTSRCIIDQITDKNCRADLAATYGHQGCIAEGRDAIIWAFEPVPKSFDAMITRSEKLEWPQHGQWIGFQAAVGEKDSLISFFSNGDEGDEHASQDIKAAGSTDELKVQQLSLDRLMLEGLSDRPQIIMKGAKHLFEPSRQLDIFLLKIDVEGYDYFVLNGCRQLLQAKRIKYLTFEYNNKWFTNGRSFELREAVAMLLELNYICYWITPARLIPLSGLWWHAVYEIKAWSNVFCGQRGDLDFYAAVDGHNGRYTFK